jgi:hypothetical protein
MYVTDDLRVKFNLAGEHVADWWVQVNTLFVRDLNGYVDKYPVSFAESRELARLKREIMAECA